jgi:integrase
MEIWRKACKDAKTPGEGYKIIKENHNLYNYRNSFKIIGNDREKCPSLHEICFLWFHEHKKSKLIPKNKASIEETTVNKYEYHLKILKDCPQDMFEQKAIKVWLVEKAKKSPGTAKILLSIIRNSFAWGKDEELIPSSVLIETKHWNEAIQMASETKSPKWAKEKGYINTSQQFRGFSLKDTQTVLDSLKTFKWNNYPIGYFFLFGKLKFLPGCRTGEGLALQWKHFDESQRNEEVGRFGILRFEQSFSQDLGREKSIKNHKPHQLPCNQELASFLLDIQPESYELSDYIIEPNLKGKERVKFFQEFRRCWAGYYNTSGKKERVCGFMEELLDEGKLTQIIYRSPYATRHTFITTELNTGVPLGTVAAWVGDKPETIAKHYMGSDDLRVPSLLLSTSTEPALNPSFKTYMGQSDSPNQALIDFLKSELGAQKKENANMRQQLDEMHQMMLNLSRQFT